MGIHVVTGSASGIGLAARKRLESEGNRVIGVDLRDAEIVTDLAVPAERAAVVDQIRREVAALDGVTAAAGVGAPTPNLSRIVGVNFFGVRDLLVGLRPLLAERPNSKAVVISSNTIAFVPIIPQELVETLLAENEAEAEQVAAKIGADILVYAASKLAITRWTRAAAITPEWIGAGIRLNCVAPGVTKTPMFDRALSDPVVAASIDIVPNPRGVWAEADEVARVVEALLSSVADAMAGQTIFVDGGTAAAIEAAADR